VAAAEGRHLPGDALHGKTVGPVGGDRQFEHLVIEAQGRTQGGSDRWQGRQEVVEDGDALRALGQAQLLEGADHARTGHTPQFGRLDRQSDRRQMGADGGDGDVDAAAHIGGPADDLQRLVGADLNLANTEFAGVGMGLAGLHESNHHSGTGGREILDRLDLETGDRKAFGQLFRLQQG
jgi:hypothetical protein